MKQLQKRWSEDEKKIVLGNYGKLSYEQISLLLPNRNWFQVRNQANYLGLTNKSNLGRKYSTNKNFFTYPNLLNCYWAGFIAADGCVRRNKLSIGLAHLDANHLEQFVKDISFTGKIYYYEKAIKLEISCDNYVQDLFNIFNITERKSLTLKPPHIENEDLVSAYIIGLIDGDGCISFKRPGNICISISGTQFVLEWVKEYFDKWTSVSNYKRSIVRKRNDQSKISYYQICSSRAEEIYERFSLINVPRLSRKWDKFKC